MARMIELLGWWIERYLTFIGAIHWDKGGSSVKPVNPMLTAQAQDDINQKQFYRELGANRVNTNGPLGATWWSQDGNGNWTSNTKLTDAQQSILNGQQYNAGRMNDLVAKYTNENMGPMFEPTPTYSPLTAPKVARAVDVPNARKMLGMVQGAKPSKIVKGAKTTMKIDDGGYSISAPAAASMGMVSIPTEYGMVDIPAAQARVADPTQYAGVNAPDVGKTFDVPLYNAESELRYLNSLRQRQDPILQQQRESLQTQLANQGLMPGSPAYDRAMDAFTRQANDVMNTNILTATDYGTKEYANELAGFGAQRGQENDMFGQRLDRANFQLADTEALRQQALNKALFGSQEASRIDDASLRGAEIGVQQYKNKGDFQLGGAGLGIEQNKAAADVALQNAANELQASIAQGQLSLGQAQLRTDQRNDKFGQRMTNKTFKAGQRQTKFNQQTTNRQFKADQKANRFNSSLAETQTKIGQRQGLFGQRLSSKQFQSGENQAGYASQIARQQIPLQNLQGLYGLSNQYQVQVPQAPMYFQGQTGSPVNIGDLVAQYQGTKQAGANASSAATSQGISAGVGLAGTIAMAAAIA